jgi:peptidoglycan/xylan/chitin deacetylase (PgdA/CDA1 family)
MKEYHFVGIVGLILAKIDESDYLNWEQIRKLQWWGWELASHTWHHPNLSELPREFIPYQIDQSKKDLEKWFQTPIHIFIYPKWRYTYATLDQIKSSGYSYAFTTQTGQTNLSDKPLELKRIDVIPGMTIDQFMQLLEPVKPIHEK